MCSNLKILDVIEFAIYILSRYTIYFFAEKSTDFRLRFDDLCTVSSNFFVLRD
jgi:hypothetical protein